MAKDMVKLAFIFAIVFCFLSDVTNAEKVEKRSSLESILEGETVLAANEVEQAPSRRYGPLIRQPIFSGRVRGLENYICKKEPSVESCDICNRRCIWNKRSLFFECLELVPNNIKLGD